MKWWHSQAFKFITNWSLNLLVKEFIKSANIGKITGRMVDCVICPFALTLCPRRCRHRQISKTTSVWRTEMLLIVVMLIGRLMWYYYQLISNCCRSVLTHWLTDWRRQWLADCWSRRFCVILLRHLFLCYTSCVQLMQGFYMADVITFVYQWLIFYWANTFKPGWMPVSYMTVCFNFMLSMAIFWI